MAPFRPTWFEEPVHHSNIAAMVEVARRSPVCSAACAQVNASLPNFYMHEIFDEYNEPWEESIITNPVKVVDGYIEVSDRPGLGVDLNIEEILRHPYQQEKFLPLFKPGWELRRSQEG